MQRRFGGIVPEPKITRRNPAVRLNRGGFEDEHSSARCGHRTQVHEMPIGGFAIDGAVLAHRCNHESVFEGQVTKRGAREECTHRSKNRIAGGAGGAGGAGSGASVRVPVRGGLPQARSPANRFEPASK